MFDMYLAVVFPKLIQKCM